MNINNTFKQLKRTMDVNSPIILTGMALAGAGITAFLAAKGGMKAQERLHEVGMMNIPDGDPYTGKLADLISTQDKFLATYKFYIPAAAALTGTSACMIMATKIGLDRTAALAGALVVVERTNDQYKDKVKELLGDNKHLKVTDAVAADQVNKTPLPDGIFKSEGDQWFLDRWSGRYFATTRERIDRAVNDLNHEMLYGGYCSLNEFYKRLNLEDVTEGDEVGWNKSQLVELVYTPILKDDSTAVVAFEFDRKPMPTFRDDSV